MTATTASSRAATPAPDTAPILDTAAGPAVRRNRRGGARRALTRSWREALIPLGPGDTGAVPHLRALARRILDGWNIPAALVDDVELAVSELAANALIHTDGPVRVRLAYRERTVRLDVADTSPHHPTVRVAPEDAVHGRGLGIVAALAARMRIEPYPGHPYCGKVMIAEFRVN